MCGVVVIHPSPGPDHVEIADAGRLAQRGRGSRLLTRNDLQVPVIPLRSARRHPYLMEQTAAGRRCVVEGWITCVKSPNWFCPATPTTPRIGRPRSAVRKPANGCCSASEPTLRPPLCRTCRRRNRRKNAGATIRTHAVDWGEGPAFRGGTVPLQQCPGAAGYASHSPSESAGNDENQKLAD